MNALVRHADAGWEKWKALALDSVTSGHTRRAYASALDHFLDWYRAASRGPLSKAVVNAYKAHLEAAGRSASTTNVRLCALRKLVSEAADNGLIPMEVAAAIARVRGVPWKWPPPSRGYEGLPSAACAWGIGWTGARRNA